MIGNTPWPWVALALLGALHGLNPGMGWLLAVARGMQEGDGRAVWRALVPLAAGHAAAIALAVLAARLMGLVVPAALVRWGVIVALVVLGVRQMTRHRHPRFGGMRMSDRTLAVWSFLVASAHGAGLMAVPFAAEAGAGAIVPALHAAPPPPAGASPAAPGAKDAWDVLGGRHAHRATHARYPARTSVSSVTLLATGVHALGYLLVTGLLAVVVFERAGTRFLRRAWINLDVLWAGSLLLTAVALAVTGGGA